ncbi:MAG TPA: family 1 glycosylhydrolase [Polyangiaceae bacterium]|nr:family 1 glycosylhydrolase [Polyangiaceae bacterium]
MKLYTNRPDHCPIELWGGLECTVNRVGDAYLDQLELSGHARRESDLDRFAALGLRTLRYPVLWERVAPRGPASADWTWPDRRLARLRELGVAPIAGLVHHGSGPPDTSLVDPAFPERLAEYAGAVAARYPWVEAYTPINEPLTTARFSGLYGHWYPHGKDDHTFVRALLTQCRAVVLAMGAVRRANPGARLVQTEDMGHTRSTPALSYQAELENERRWLSLDLLSGRVTASHPLRDYLRGGGATDADLGWFEDNPCPPDVLGINHYVTSERFLDDRLELYPPHTHGGNGRHRYADVEAVRVCLRGLRGLARLLLDAWGRYRTPIVVTEAHLGCDEIAEQVRWLVHVVREARAARAAGADVRAVTAWALLGLHDWDTLVTRPGGRYEPGVFCLADGEPRPTPLADAVARLAAGLEPGDSALGAPGWWARDERLLYPAFDEGESEPPASARRERARPSRPAPARAAAGRGRY